MIDVDASIEPPGLDIADDDEHRPGIHVVTCLSEGDGTTRNASSLLAADATDGELADALIACLRGVAAMRGPGLVDAIESRLQ